MCCDTIAIFLPFNQSTTLQLPGLLIQSLLDAPGFDKASFEAVHASGVPVTSIRRNAQKITAGLLEQHFGANIQGVVPWNVQGYYLEQRPSFTIDPLLHAGAYYVQDASSMFLEEVLRQVIDLNQPLKVLDLCAAPGGKSTLIQGAINNDSLLVSNEVIKTRVNILAENITKWGAANVIVTNNDPKEFQRLPGYFDVIVIDAPCSGSGLFRKDPQAIGEWSEQNVQLCSQRQQRILADCMSSLKQGGTLIYSTCSYSVEEDESICDWLLGEYPLASIKLQLQTDWNIIETSSPQKNAWGYRFYPDKIKGEGLFIAAFKMCKVEETGSPAIKIKAKTEKLKPTAATTLSAFIKDFDAYIFIKQHEDVIALPARFEQDLNIIKSTLYIKKAGVKLGTLIRNELIPDHELAVSMIAHENINQLEVDLDTALQYLRRQDIAVAANHKGWVLITYQQLPLGWIKVLPNRVNNYYPKDWRILHK